MGGCQGGPGNTCSGGFPKVLLVNSSQDRRARDDDGEVEFDQIPTPKRAIGSSLRKGGTTCHQLCRDVREQLNQMSNLLECDGVTNGAQLLLRKVKKQMDELDSELTREEESKSSRLSKLLDEDETVMSEKDQARQFVLQTFTHFQPAIVESSAMLDPLAFKRPKGRRESLGFLSTSEALQDQAVNDVIAQAGTSNFDAIKLASLPAVKHRPIRIIGTYLMEKSGLFEDIEANGWVIGIDLFRSRALHFLGAIDDLYKQEAIYHGAHHAADSVSTVEWFMHLDTIRKQTHTLDHFMSLMSAAIHDVGHPGTNNLFETKTMSPLAVRYNDSSVLENYHVSLACSTMQKDIDSNWFEMLPKEYSQSGEGPFMDMQQYMRRGLIEMVLSTDMARHSDHVSQLKDLLNQEQGEQENGSKNKTQGQKQESLEKKLLLLKTVLHAADISNPCKPKDIMLGWCERVILEFWNQGDKERQLNLPISPLCDRESGKDIIPKGQIGFIKFVIQPFFKAVVELLPGAEEATDELENNLAFWTVLDKKGAKFEEIFPNSAALSAN